jgi:thioredoxin 1
MANETKKAGGFATLLASNSLVLADFSAEWCGPCKMMKPVLETLKKQVGDAVTIVKIDVDRNPEASTAYNIQSVPTLMLFKDGGVKWRQSGVVPAEQLARIINQHL